MDHIVGHRGLSSASNETSQTTWVMYRPCSWQMAHEDSKERCVVCSSSWNGNHRALLVSVSCQPITLLFSSSGYTLPYAGCSRTAMEVIKLSKRAEGIFTLFFLVLSHCTQLFSANALWSLGSVLNMRELLSEYQCCYLIALFRVHILACSQVAGLHDTGKGGFYQSINPPAPNC